MDKNGLITVVTPGLLGSIKIKNMGIKKRVVFFFSDLTFWSSKAI